MPLLGRLLKASSMSGAVRVYVPATVLQRGLGLVRIVLLARLFDKVHLQGQYSLWGLGLLLFSLLTPLLPLGANHGLARYVSLFETRGRLEDFYRRIRMPILGCVILLTAIAAAAHSPIASILFSSSSEQIEHVVQTRIVLLAIANACVLALYVNMLGFLTGMRLYTLVSAIELFFSVFFTVAALAAVVAVPTAASLLTAHLVSVGVSLGVGMIMLSAAVKAVESCRPKLSAVSNRPHVIEPADEMPPQPVQDATTPASDLEAQAELPPMRGAFLRIARFGIASMFSNTVWMAMTYLSFWLVSRHYGGDSAQAGMYWFFFQISQPVSLLATAAWNSISAHVAKHWESGLRLQAIRSLEVAFKAVALATLVLTALIYLLSPWWVLVVSPVWRDGLDLLPGLLMFFQATGNLGILYLVAWLHERPGVTLLAVLGGAAAITALAQWWLSAYGLAGAAWAAGIGMFVGSLVVAVPYLLSRRQRLHVSSYVCLVSPAVLVLAIPWGATAVAAAVALVVAAAIFTPWLFDSRQKSLLKAAVRQAARLGGRRA
ncbi:MAG: hypothetical protein GXY38_12665 [Planctomycetes bacterium]|nr:hypothetical protein [Planctomycetota bacterium]